MGLDVESVLAAHRAIVSGDEDGWHVVCTCGHEERGHDPVRHVAAVLREQIAEWLGSEAARVAAECGVHAIEGCEPDPSVEQYARSALAALSAQFAPSRVPSEES